LIAALIVVGSPRGAIRFSTGIVLALVELVAQGILGSGSTVETEVMLANDTPTLSRQGARKVRAYRVPMGLLLSLATSLLVSLETPEVADWTLSVT